MKRHINYYFLGLVVFLMVFGIVFLATLSSLASLNFFGNTTYYLFKQLTNVAIGLVLCLIIFKLPLPLIKKLAPWLLLANLVLLIIVFLPVVGANFWGASRWISISSITIQPSEFLKITAVLYVSALLAGTGSRQSGRRNVGFSMKQGYETLRRALLPFLVLVAVIIVILKYQKDLSTLGIILVALLAVYFCAKTPGWHMLLAFLLGLSVLVFFIMHEPYRMERLKVFLNPESDPLGMGLQVKQSLIAIGSGGIFGKGLGMSVQKFGFLPQAMSDSIFAILGEETGIIGCVILVVSFLLFLWFGFRIAHAAEDDFGKLVAVGISTWIVFQAFVNILSSVGFFPLTGIPLPFFSHGGSHIIAELIGVGLLLNISKNG